MRRGLFACLHAGPLSPAQSAHSFEAMTVPRVLETTRAYPGTNGRSRCPWGCEVHHRPAYQASRAQIPGRFGSSMR